MALREEITGGAGGGATGRDFRLRGPRSPEVPLRWTKGSPEVARSSRGQATARPFAADGERLGRLTDAFYEPIRACTKPYPDTREILTRLRSQGTRLAIITNAPWDTPARLLRGDLERWRIEGFFDAFICSGEVPWRKPNPAFMLAAAEALGIAADECLVVGDTLESDIAGARAAGMRSAWINRAGAPAPPEGAQPEWVATSLARVAQIVAGARPTSPR